MSWLRSLVILAVLIIVLLGAGWLASEPVLRPKSVSSPVPRLVRAGETPLAVGAEAALILRLRTGEILYSRNADVRLPIASLTKLMTALLLAGGSHPLAEVEFSEAAKGVMGRDYAQSTAEVGEKFKAEDIIRMLLVSSYNDAAYAAAEYVAVARQPEITVFGERINFFSGLMNERAAKLGLADTKFSNPAGFDSSDNYSTASDLARLAAAITSERPELWASSRLLETAVFSKGGRRHELINTNPLLREFPSIYGSKTGNEEKSGGTLLMLYRLRPDEIFVIVLLRSSDRFGPNGDGRAAIEWLEKNFVIESS